MSGNKLYYHSKCVARATSLQKAPSRLQLSVRQPRQGCLPWCSKKRTVATFCFKKAHWQQGASGEYEQTAECGVKNLAKLRRLSADLPVKVKYWTKGRPSKLLLQVSLGALLDQVEGSPASEAWLAFTATGQEQRVYWQPADHQDCADADPSLSDDAVEDLADPPLEHDGLEDLADPPMGYDDLWDSGEEDLDPETPSPCAAEEGKGSDGEWVTFNLPTGKMLRLPRHTEEETAAKWRGPGAWTSEDDLISPRALRIVKGIRPAVKRSRLPECPHWWELGSGGTPAAAETHLTQRTNQHDTGLFPLDWNLPTFPECSAAPRRRGEANARVPEMAMSAPTSSGEADAELREAPLPARHRGGAVRSRAKRPARPFLCVVITVAYMIFVAWVFIKDENFLNAISEQVDELFGVSGLTRFVHQAKARRLSLETFRKLSGLGTK